MRAAISNTRAVVVAAIVVLSGIAVAGPARAEDAAARAKHHNAEATKYFNLGKFREAAVEYEKAYQAKPLAAFLHNLGQCYKRMAALENLERALFYFESYLNNAPDSPLRKEVEQEIADLKRQIAKLRKARVRSATDEATAPETTAKKQPAPRPLDEQLGPAAAAPAEKPRSEPLYKKWWFWTAVAVVVAGAATATIVVAQPATDNGVMGTLDPGQIQF